MKKLIALLVVLTMLLGLAACGTTTAALSFQYLTTITTPSEIRFRKSFACFFVILIISKPE